MTEDRHALKAALEVMETAKEQAAVNAQKAERLDIMLRDLLGVAERYVQDARDRIKRVPAQHWDQVEAIAETVAPLEARIADIRRLL